MKNQVTKNKRIKSLKLVKHTYTWHAKISKTRKQNGTYKVTEEVREKHRINKIKRMIDNGTLIWPNYNIAACKIFDRLEADLKLDGFYATKNRERRIGRYWVDYYNPTHNIVIEYDEPYHYRRGKLSIHDLNKQRYIVDTLKCQFIRIKEGTKYGIIKRVVLHNLSR